MINKFFNKIRLSKSILLVLLGMIIISSLFVAKSTFAVDGKLESPYADGVGTDIFSFIDYVITNIILPIGGSVAVFFLIYTGFCFVIAQGKEDKIKDARKMLLYTLIGIALLFGAKAVSLAVKNTIGKLIPGVVTTTK